MQAVVRPESIEELAHWVREASVVDPSTLDRSGLRGIVDYSPADQTATVRAGTSLAELQAVFGEHGQCLPYAPDAPDWLGMPDICVGEAMDRNLPHALDAPCGNWRDWTLGTTMVLADGSVVKSGCKVVKSVAGYDLHKLFVGARGSLGVLVEVTLRTLPLAARSEADFETFGQRSNEVVGVTRVLRSDLDAFLQAAEGRLYAIDRLSATGWLTDLAVPRFAHDWRLAPMDRPLLDDPVALRYYRRAKAEFDPEGKMAPNAFGEAARG